MTGTPLKIWLTRPDSGEIYNGMWRSVRVWTSQPDYSHFDRAHDFSWPDGRPKYVDDGWLGSSTGAKGLLKQDPELMLKVWHQIALSCAPRGMDIDQAWAWIEEGLSEDQGLSDQFNYRLLYSDREWESKCNTCHKRFLLEIDVRTNDVQRIKPRVHLRGGSRSKTEITDEISTELALEYWHPRDDPNAMPF